MRVLDTLIFGIRSVALAGVQNLVTRNTINFAGPGVTVADNPVTLQTDVTVNTGAASSIGGGAAGSSQTGAVTLPSTSACISVNLTTTAATVNLGSVTAIDGLAYIFDLVGTSTTVPFTLNGASIVSSSQGSTPETSVTFYGTGQSIMAKYSGDTATWQVK